MKVLNQICRSRQDTVLFKAAFLVGFFGAFRVSELVPGSTGDTSRRALKWRDLQSLIVRILKTDWGAWVGPW